MKTGKLLALLLLLVPCITLGKVTLTIDSVKLNPAKYSPLTAIVYAHSSAKGSIGAKVIGKNGPDSDISHRFNEIGTQHRIEVLGLYGDYENTVELTLYNSKSKIKAITTVQIQTREIYAPLLDVTIDTAQIGKMAPGLTLINNTSNQKPCQPFMIDAFGDVRWYFNFGDITIDHKKTYGHPVMREMNYAVGMFQLKNGNFCFGKQGIRYIYEFNFFGEGINSWNLYPYTFHHEVYEKPNGNFLVTVSDKYSKHKKELPTIEDFIIEIDRNTKKIIRVWDLKEALDEHRMVTNFNFLTKDPPVDWIHINAVLYDDRDSSIIVSGRHQGVVKLTQDNKVKWILGHHKGWGKSRDGVDLNQYLLQPLDAKGEAILDTTVLNGYQGHPDFDWCWMQHAPQLLDNGNLMLFDNGNYRNFKDDPRYTRAVEYKIDEENMTVQQVWEYGKERGVKLHSKRAGDIDFLENLKHVMISSSYIEKQENNLHAKFLELDYETKEIIFEATFFPTVGVNVFHRCERMQLYR
jgi:arylsulfate sulfotransferase